MADPRWWMPNITSQTFLATRLSSVDPAASNLAVGRLAFQCNNIHVPCGDRLRADKASIFA